MPVYLLHFERRYWHAGHYLGWTQDLPGRMRAHRAGDGARLMEVISAHGIRWVVSRVWWDGDRNLERSLKAWHNGPLHCPVCRGECTFEECHPFLDWLLGQQSYTVVDQVPQQFAFW